MELGESSHRYEDFRALKQSSNDAFRSDKLIYKEQCFVFLSLVYSVAKSVGRYWIGPQLADSVGEELVRVLDEGLEILQSCAESNKASPGLISVILGSLSQFYEIIDDVSKYSQMIGHVSNDLLRMVNQIESDCKLHQSILESAYLKDKHNLNTSLESSLRNIPKDFLPKALSQQPEIPSIDRKDLRSSEKTTLGSGSFGEVIAATLWDKFPVAVKQFQPGDTSFDKEIAVFRKLKTVRFGCSHIVQIIGESKSSHNCLVLELMQANLGNLLENSKKEPCRISGSKNGFTGHLLEMGQLKEKQKDALLQSVDIMLQIAKAMKHLHDYNVIYRDMKPSNVLVKTRGGNFVIKIADFGASKANFKEGSTNSDMTGTLFYMAPEMSEVLYSKKVDIFSFGIVCCQILAAQFKWEEQKESSTDDQKKEELKRKVTEEINICLNLRKLIGSCWERNPFKRPTFACICEELWRIKKELLTGIEAPPTPVHEVTELQQSQISTPIDEVTATRKKTVQVFELSFFNSYNIKDLPMDQLVDIIFPCIEINSEGRVGIMDEWNSIYRPFIKDDGVDPQNKPFGNSAQDLGVVGQFKKLLKDQGKRFNLSLGIHTSHQGSMAEDSLNFILDFLEVYKIFNGIYIQYHDTVQAIDVHMLEQIRNAQPNFIIGLSPHIAILPSIQDISPDMFDHLYLSSKEDPIRQLAKHIHSTKIIIDESQMDTEKILNLITEEELGGVVIYNRCTTEASLFQNSRQGLFFRLFSKYFLRISEKL